MKLNVFLEKENVKSLCESIDKTKRTEAFDIDDKAVIYAKPRRLRINK